MARKPPKGSGIPPQGTGSARGRSSRPEGPVAGRPTQPDVGAIARALSTGFMILVFGGLIQPVVTSFVPVIGLLWLILVALAAFVTTGYRAGAAGPNPPLYGAGAAVGAYLLVVPLLFLQGTFEPVPALSTLIAAAVVGALCGILADRLRASNG